MELTRRDALAALAAAGVGSVAGCSGDVDPPTATRHPPDPAEEDLDDHALATLAAAGEVVYPSEAEGIREFVETYVVGRVADRPDHRTGLADAVADLDSLARDWKGAAFVDLPAEARDDLLRDVGADVAEPDPDGPLPERLRFFVVNDLLYAFYASPTGGGLVGIENPVGYPGGTESYQRPPPDERGDTDG